MSRTRTYDTRPQRKNYKITDCFIFLFLFYFFFLASFKEKTSKLIFPSVFHHPYVIILIFPSSFFHLHFVIRIFPSAFYHPHFIIRILSSVFYHQHFNLSSAFYYPPFAIRHPPSAIRRHPVLLLQRPCTNVTLKNKNKKRLQVAFTHAQVHMGALFP